MAIFGMKVKSRRETRVSGFHAEYLNDRTAIRQRKQMGYIRAMLSASSLLFGGGMIYVAFHYIPAFVHPKQVLKLATGEPPAMKTYDFDRKSQFHDVFGPYLKLFHLDRTYMRAGQTIDIKYDLPAGAYADLEIVRCQKAWVVEIFKCNVVSNYSTKTKRQRGVESYSLKVGGFYHFRQQVSGVPEGEPYRIVWERGL